MTASDIIGRWPSAEQFGRDIGLKYPSHARVMKLRGGIPRAHWQAVIEAAEARGFTITRDDLMRAHATAPEPA